MRKLDGLSRSAVSPEPSAGAHFAPAVAATATATTRAGDTVCHYGIRERLNALQNVGSGYPTRGEKFFVASGVRRRPCRFPCQQVTYRHDRRGRATESTSRGYAG